MQSGPVHTPDNEPKFVPASAQILGRDELGLKPRSVSVLNHHTFLDVGAIGFVYLDISAADRLISVQLRTLHHKAIDEPSQPDISAARYVSVVGAD